MSGTFVFLDLEGTGVKEPRRIVQIAAIACPISVFRKAQPGRIPSDVRLFNKTLNPEKPLEDHAARLTGLSEASLKRCPKFTHILHELKGFFARLDQPIYLIAHNGLLYDFPLLHEEVKRTGDKLGMRLREIDTVPIFKQLGLKHEGLRDIYDEYYHEDHRLSRPHEAMVDAEMLFLICQKKMVGFCQAVLPNPIAR